MGHGRRHDRRVQAHPHEEGRADDVRHPRRPRGPGRAARLQLRLREERGPGGRGPVVLVRGRVDHKEAGETKLVAQEVEPFEPTPEEVAAAAAEAAGRAGGQAPHPARVAGRSRGLPRGAPRGGGPPPRRPRAAARRGRAAAAARRRASGCRPTAPAAASWGPCTGPLAWSPERPGRRSTLAGCSHSPRRPRSSTSAASAAPSATAWCIPRAASPRAASSSTSTTTRRPAAASWAA